MNSLTEYKFSVLISIYHKEKPKFLRLALDSIWDYQILKPTEIVIVKDGPLSGDLERVLMDFQKKAPVKMISFPENMGLGQALKIGVLNCQYNLIARMDSDDISHPERFSKQIDFLCKNEDVDMVGTWIDEFLDKEDNIISTRKVPGKHSDIISYLKGRCPFNHPTVMFKRESVLQSGSYLECHLKEDLYLWLRLYQNNFVFANIQESLLLFRTTKDIYRRRGGMKYAKSELKMFNYRYQIGLINIYQYVYYNSLTIPVRLMPPFLRSLTYKYLLR